MPFEVTLRLEPLDSTAARTLIGALNAELGGRYPEAGPDHFRLDPEEVGPGRGAFLVAYAEDEPVGCGAIRRLDASTAEVKRMYVVPALRGRGIAGRVLAALEDEARALGVARLVLETGVRQPEALALYQRCGYAKIAAFGAYVDSELSVFLGKTLTSPRVRR